MVISEAFTSGMSARLRAGEELSYSKHHVGALTSYSETFRLRCSDGINCSIKEQNKNKPTKQEGKLSVTDRKQNPNNSSKGNALKFLKVRDARGNGIPSLLL